MNIKARLAQINPQTGDIRGNKALIFEEIEKTGQDVDLIAFPEMALTGYCIRDLIENNAFIEENLEALDEIKEKTGETAVVLGFIDKEDGDLYNAAAVIQNGEIKGVSHKALLPNYRYFDDKRYFDSGEDIKPIEIEVSGEKISLGVSICEDMWDSEYDREPVSKLEEKGTDFLLNINASPFESGKRKKRHELIQRHIKDTGLPFLYLNTAGVADMGDNILVFDGDSLAYNFEGELIGKGKQFGQKSFKVDIETGKSGVFKGDEIETERREKEIFEALSFAVKDYCRKTGFKKIVETISGGIDSSLGLAVCVEALGSENVEAFNLPSEVNVEETKRDAEKLTGNLGVKYSSIPVEDIYQETLESYEKNYSDVEYDVSKENVYARTRQMIMMLASNEKDSALLVSNGNETEIGLGYVTLYGDMAGGLNILGDLSKKEVYEVARYVNERHEKEVIPDSVFERRPSAELREGQVDPFDYSTVSPVIKEFLEERKDPQQIISEFENQKLEEKRYSDRKTGESIYEKYSIKEFKDIVYDTHKRFQNSSFKRVQAPPIIAVSSRAFGTDFRESILNGYNPENSS